MACMKQKHHAPELDDVSNIVTCVSRFSSLNCRCAGSDCAHSCSPSRSQHRRQRGNAATATAIELHATGVEMRNAGLRTSSLFLTACIASARAGPSLLADEAHMCERETSGAAPPRHPGTRGGQGGSLPRIFSALSYISKMRSMCPNCEAYRVRGAARRRYSTAVYVRTDAWVGGGRGERRSDVSS